MFILPFWWPENHSSISWKIPGHSQYSADARKSQILWDEAVTDTTQWGNLNLVTILREVTRLVSFKQNGMSKLSGQSLLRYAVNPCKRKISNLRGRIQLENGTLENVKGTFTLVHSWVLSFSLGTRDKWNLPSPLELLWHPPTKSSSSAWFPRLWQRSFLRLLAIS